MNEQKAPYDYRNTSSTIYSSLMTIKGHLRHGSFLGCTWPHAISTGTYTVINWACLAAKRSHLKYPMWKTRTPNLMWHFKTYKLMTHSEINQIDLFKTKCIFSWAHNKLQLQQWTVHMLWTYKFGSKGPRSEYEHISLYSYFLKEGKKPKNKRAKQKHHHYVLYECISDNILFSR